MFEFLVMCTAVRCTCSLCRMALWASHWHWLHSMLCTNRWPSGHFAPSALSGAVYRKQLCRARQSCRCWLLLHWSKVPGCCMYWHQMCASWSLLVCRVTLANHQGPRGMLSGTTSRLAIWQLATWPTRNSQIHPGASVLITTHAAHWSAMRPGASTSSGMHAGHGVSS